MHVKGIVVCVFKCKIENQWVKKREGGTWNSERRRNWRKERAEEWVLENWERRRGSLGRHLHLHWTCCCCCGGKGISETSDGFSSRNHPTFPISRSPYYSLLISNQFASCLLFVCFLTFLFVLFCFRWFGLGPQLCLPDLQLTDDSTIPFRHLLLLARSLPRFHLSPSPRLEDGSSSKRGSNSGCGSTGLLCFQFHQLSYVRYLFLSHMLLFAANYVQVLGWDSLWCDWICL